MNKFLFSETAASHMTVISVMRWSGGRFDAWLYRRGKRIDLLVHDEHDIKAYCNKWDCRLVMTDEAKLFSHYL